MNTAKDTVGIRVSKLCRLDALIELSGEFDVCDLEPLRRVLGDALNSGLLTTVDLSRVSFLDVRCTRELAVQSHLCDYLLLRNPSWQVEASFRACGFEDPTSSCNGHLYEHESTPTEILATL